MKIIGSVEKSSAMMSKSLTLKPRILKVTHDYGKIVYNMPITLVN